MALLDTDRAAIERLVSLTGRSPDVVVGLALRFALARQNGFRRFAARPQERAGRLAAALARARHALADPQAIVALFFTIGVIVALALTVAGR